jgi:hypothetical protein
MAWNHKRLWQLVATVKACKYGVRIRSGGTLLRPGALQPFGKSNQGTKSGRQYHQAQIEVFRKPAIARCYTSLESLFSKLFGGEGEPGSEDVDCTLEYEGGAVSESEFD